MMVDCATRDLSRRAVRDRACLAAVHGPIGVLGICAQDGHGDLATAHAAAHDRRADDRLDALQRSAGGGRARRSATGPASSSSTRPNDRALAESFVAAPRRPGSRRSSSRSTPGARLAAARSQRRQLPAAARPLRSPTTSAIPAFARCWRSRRGGPARAAIALGARIRQAAHLGRSAVAALADQAAADAQGHLPSRRRAPRDRRRRRRDLLLQPRRPASQRRRGGDRLAAGVVAACGQHAGPVRLRRSLRRPTSSRRSRSARALSGSAALTPTGSRSTARTGSCTCCAACSPRPTS